MRNLTLAYSSCPNDTFIFYALANKLLKFYDNIGHKNSEPSVSEYFTFPDNFKITIADVETLNQQASNSIFDITKLSFATLGNVRDKYAILRSGAALGRGCGPLLVSTLDNSKLIKNIPETLQNKLNSISDINFSKLNVLKFKTIGTIRPVVAVPGIGTTAFVLFSLFIKESFPNIAPRIIPMSFEKIMPAVKDGSADFGVIIHEGRFTYHNFGLECVVDLGKWWESVTGGLPIPLGCIAIKRDICEIAIKNPMKINGCENNLKLASVVQELIKQSIQYAFDNPESSKDYIKAHAQELDDKVISQHISLYVNEFSRDIGTEGERAIHTFFQKAEEVGIIKPNLNPLFAC